MRSLSIAFLLGSLSVFLLLSIVRSRDQQTTRTLVDDSPIVARIGGHAIRLPELEQRAAIALYQADRQRNTVLLKTLQDMIDEALLERHAAEKGLTVEQLLAGASTSAEVARLANYPKPVKQLSTGSPEVAQDGWLNDFQEEARIRQALVVSLRRRNRIEITLPEPQPPVLSVSTDGDPSLGPPDAPVTIVEFSDFQCPYCKLSVPVIQELLTRYPGQIRVVYRDFPGPNHPHAVRAAEAAQCAGEQAKFWEYHDLLFQRQEAGWDFAALAHELGLDAGVFATCFNGSRYRAEVVNDLQDGLKIGVTSTPTFFVNGRPLVGVHPVADFDRLIALARQP